eukprot:Hpha_TRINITY_DN10498_c0_g1::TRINITY_DN10498_c0_g1_i1::g.193244::m.193244
MRDVSMALTSTRTEAAHSEGTGSSLFDCRIALAPDPALAGLTVPGRGTGVGSSVPAIGFDTGWGVAQRAGMCEASAGLSNNPPWVAPKFIFLRPPPPAEDPPEVQ